jgi:hypothetical protein
VAAEIGTQQALSVIMLDVDVDAGANACADVDDDGVLAAKTAHLSFVVAAAAAVVVVVAVVVMLRQHWHFQEALIELLASK